MPPPSHEQTIEAIVRCDIPRANIRIQYEDILQSDEITVRDLGALTDQKMRCLRAAVHPSYILTIEDYAQRAAFYEFSRREDRPREQAEARDWLRTRGLLDRVPTFDPNLGLDKFAHALEVGCGLKPGSGLIPAGKSTLATSPELLKNSNFEALADAAYCLMQMFAASDASEHDVRLVFIGNAALPEIEER